MQRAQAATTFENAIPILRVANLSRSLDYYVRVLGFRHEWGEDGFACITRDSVSIYLSEGDQGAPGTWVWVGVGDVASLHKEFAAKGATILHAPETFPWAVEMKVGDPDGHVLRFGSDPL